MSQEVEKTKEEPRKIADGTNFRELHCVKGKAGIYLFVARNSKNGLITLRSWKDIFSADRKTITVKGSDIIPLDSFVFHTTAKETIQVPVVDKEGKFIEKKVKGKKKDDPNKEYETEDKEIDVIYYITDVFNNLNEYENTLEGDISIEDLDLSDTDSLIALMDIAVPKFDPQQFKDYHLRKVIKYYVWFKEALVEFNAFNEKLKKK